VTTTSVETSSPTKRKPRKRISPVRGGKNPAASEALRKMWADPVRRAEVTAKLRARGVKGTRLGITDGMTRAQAEKKWAKAEKLSEKFIKTMEDIGQLPEVVVPESEEALAKEALKEAFKLAVGPYNGQTKNAAIRTVLEWTKAKPESKSKLTINKAEEWLAEIAADMKNKDNDADAL
jgi:thioesterase domain-containing protein